MASGSGIIATATNRRSFLLAATAFAVINPGNAWAGILGTPGQHDKETLALRLFHSAAVQKQLAILKDVYHADPLSKTQAGQITLEKSAEAWAMNSAQFAANSDPDRPEVMWTTQPEHRWFGSTQPRASSSGDNPDNVYRYIPIDGNARYEIRGKVKRPGPTQQTFDIDAPKAGSAVASHVQAFSNLRSEDIVFAPDGSFVVTVDSDPAGDRPNHLQSHRDTPRQEILIRDSIADWAHQNPTELEVRRIDGPPVRPPKSEAELAELAAAILAENPVFWLKWEHDFVYYKAPNQLAELPTVRKAKLVWNKGRDATSATPSEKDPSAWGMITIGHFHLATDEALVLTIKRLGAEYLSLQICDPWGPAVEYRSRTSSLNQFQSHPNADGTYTYVISAADPGVFNWLDPVGMTAGKMFVRWQALPKTVSVEDLPAQAVPVVKLVKLSELKALLPAGTEYLNPGQRKAQQVARAASFNRRLA